ALLWHCRIACISIQEEYATGFVITQMAWPDRISLSESRCAENRKRTHGECKSGEVSKSTNRHLIPPRISSQYLAPLPDSTYKRFIRNYRIKRASTRIERSAIVWGSH